MKNLFSLILIVTFIVLYGCSVIPSLDDVLPDNRKAYRKSREMPELEVPPDLTVTKNDEMSIPGEESNSLNEFERQRIQSASGAAIGSGIDDEQWLAVAGTSAQVWPKLREFWIEKGYTLELDDAELGVLETSWKEGDLLRDKFKVFTEPGPTGGTLLFLSSERQELSGGEWLYAQPDIDMEKGLIGELNLYFYGTAITENTGSTASDNIAKSAPLIPKKPKAEVVNVGEGKIYLAIPSEFMRAWRDTKLVMQRAGYFIESSDQEKGTYNFRYFKPQYEDEKKSVLSKLKFWGDEEDEEGTLYQYNLTGVGNKTEAIVMNKDGEWETGADAAVILNTLRSYYNQL